MNNDNDIRPTINREPSACVRISINQMQPTVAAPSPPAHFVINFAMIMTIITTIITMIMTIIPMVTTCPPPHKLVVKCTETD